MGNDLSRQEVAADVRYLTEQGVPLEPEELERLVTAYYKFYSTATPTSGNKNNDKSTTEGASSRNKDGSCSSSLLAQWLLTASSSETNELNKPTEAATPSQQSSSSSSFCGHVAQQTLDFVEQHILPDNFATQWARLLQLQSESSSDVPCTVNMDATPTTTSVRRKRLLLHHVETLANALGRRGNRAALGTLFQLSVGQPTALYNTQDLVDTAGREIKASVVTVLDMAYRLALATQVLLAMPTSTTTTTTTSTQSTPRSDNADDDSNEDDDDEDDKEEEDSNENNVESIDEQQQTSSETNQHRTATARHIQTMAAACIHFVHQVRIRRSVEYSPRSDAMDEADLQQGRCSKMDFLEWATHDVPLLASILPTFCQALLFAHRPVPPTLQSFVMPCLGQDSCLGTDNGDGGGENRDDNKNEAALNAILFSFGCMNKALGGTWHRLYTSTSDGLSFHKLYDALLGYNGPTLLVIRASDGSVFGAFTASCWKESKEYYGTPDCFLYQLQPELVIVRPCRRERNFMFCRSASFSKGHRRMGSSSGSTVPKGIGFGGSAHTCPRLYLDESFAACYVSSRDATFEQGHLLPRTDAYSHKQFFVADWMEVWGCGGQDVVSAALVAQSADRAVRAAYLQQARQVDKKAFVSDLRSGLIESKAFGHMDEIHGSTRFTLLNRTHGKEGYR